jgi:hypothetical protein
MVSSAIVVAKQSKTRYVLVALGALIWIAILLTIATLVSALLSRDHIAHGGSTFGAWTMLGVALVVVRAIVKWKNISATYWSVEDGSVVTHGGWLPWTRGVFEVPFDTIFETYCHRGFVGHLFKYGHCTIRRTEGNTTALVLRYVHDPLNVVGVINQRVRELRSAERTSSVVLPEPSSTADEIAKLVQLREKGEISADEFTTLKKVVVDRGAP